MPLFTTGYQVGVTPELLPFISQTTYKSEPPTIKHKNSFFYNQAGLAQQDMYRMHCEWGNCPIKVASHQELIEHVQNEHISLLPSHHSKYSLQSLRGHQLICRWRDCFEVFDARYKLFLHVQKSHFKQNKVTTYIRAHPHTCTLYYSHTYTD